jgi:hypothetical protein
MMIRIIYKTNNKLQAWLIKVRMSITLYNVLSYDSNIQTIDLINSTVMFVNIRKLLECFFS